MGASIECALGHLANIIPVFPDAGKNVLYIRCWCGAIYTMNEGAHCGQTQLAADNRGRQVASSANTEDAIHLIAPGVGKLPEIENQSGWAPDRQCRLRDTLNEECIRCGKMARAIMAGELRYENALEARLF
jgi:hypothetical protein